jgi:phospholipid/cholesterol/gamma-HCH transport system ATP-binding protein
MIQDSVNMVKTAAAPAALPVISISGLVKSFDNKKILNGLSFSVNKGENLVILGKSGSGKSLAIKCMVGLVKADSGTIKIFDTDIAALGNAQLNVTRLRIGFLFQNAALYDSMTVGENLAFPLKRHHRELTGEQIQSRVYDALSSVGLQDAADKMPAELSGGMSKRIGLARTLILDPEIILYDEPTTGLDAVTSGEINQLILAIQKKNNTSSVIITHDMACAKLTGNRLIMIKDGVIAAQGTYQELEESSDPWIRSFFV